MATEKFIAGAISSWTDVGLGTKVDSLASGSAIICVTTALDNSVSQDEFVQFSMSLGSVTTGAGAPYIGIYMYELNGDASTYGDGRFGSAVAATPPSQAFGDSMPCPISATAVLTGTTKLILLSRSLWKPLLFNLSGSTLAGSANVLKYRTWNRVVA